jgi:hypothetical protein
MSVNVCRPIKRGKRSCRSSYVSGKLNNRERKFRGVSCWLPPGRAVANGVALRSRRVLPQRSRADQPREKTQIRRTSVRSVAGRRAARPKDGSLPRPSCAVSSGFQERCAQVGLILDGDEAQRRFVVAQEGPSTLIETVAAVGTVAAPAKKTLMPKVGALQRFVRGSARRPPGCSPKVSCLTRQSCGAFPSLDLGRGQKVRRKGFFRSREAAVKRFVSSIRRLNVARSRRVPTAIKPLGLHYIPGGGLEPPCLAALDFESSTSTIPSSRRARWLSNNFGKISYRSPIFKRAGPGDSAPA